MSEELRERVVGLLLEQYLDKGFGTIRSLAQQAYIQGQMEAYQRGKAEATSGAMEMLHGLIEDGPYCNDDGECSFCGFAPNDSEDLDSLIAHKTDCKWRVAKEYLAAPEAR